MALHGKKIKTKRAHFFDVIPSGTAKAREEEVDELFVFGYAAKLFRDDEKALYIERGKHLIPWTGDESLMIDRYDGRGYLHDLSDYDVDAWNVEHQLSEEESRIETLCDEERYLALHTDLLEEQHRQEEELKRLNEAIASSESEYSAVGFSYDALPSSSSSSYAVDTYDPTQPTDDYEDEANKENQEKESTSVPDEEPFVPPNGLEIPQDVEVPATAKTHAIIAKTALFVSKNGTQMEIILKTKQANNSQFGFLSFDHYLNPYYKTVLKCIRSGKYTYIPQASEDKSDELDKEKDNHRKSKDDDASTEDEESDADGSGYLHPSLLGSKKTKSPKKTDAPPWPIGTLYPLHPLTGLGEGSLMGPFGPIIPPPPMITSTANNSGTTPAILAPPLPPFLHVAHDGSCVPPLPPPADRVTVPTFSQASAGLTALTAAPPPPPPPDEPDDLSTSSSSSIPAIVPPPPDVQPIIDKMAKYVAKNGADFEATVRAKADSRFEFLLPWHSYHAYYEYKKKLFIGDTESEIQGQIDFENKTKKIPGPVSFCIKQKEPEERFLETRSALLSGWESSGSDENDDEQKRAKHDNNFQNPEAIHLEERPKRPSLSAQELEARQAKHRLEDKLAAAAREKLAQTSRERQLQLERKKKAAMFISMIKPPAVATSTGTPDNTALCTVSSPSSVRSESPGVQIDSPVRYSPHSRSLSPVKRRSKSPPRSYRSSHKFYPRARSKSPTMRSSKPRKRRRHKSPSARVMKHSSSSNHRSKSSSVKKVVKSPSPDSRSSSGSDRKSDDSFEDYGTSSANMDLRAKVRAMLAATRQLPS